VPDARLVMREGEGHFGIYEHLGEMLGALTARHRPAPADPPRRVLAAGSRITTVVAMFR
jgi:hypothetical protein